jgi:hypothetical protein
VSTVTIAGNDPLKPKVVVLAVRLLYASIAIVFIRGIIVGFKFNTDVPLASVVLFLFFVCGIVCFLIYKISRGRNWARIVYLLLYLTGNYFTILPLFRSVAVYPLTGILGIGHAVMELIALVMLFLSPANLWFKAERSEF